MRYRFVLLCVCTMLTLSACASELEPGTESADSGSTLLSPSADTLSGTWTGDWGTSENQRNLVTVELKWDGANLTGTVNPGPEAVALSKVSYAPDTGMVTMEAPGADGKVHLAIEGRVVESAITGTWVQDDQKGDFKIQKS